MKAIVTLLLAVTAIVLGACETTVYDPQTGQMVKTYAGLDCSVYGVRRQKPSDPPGCLDHYWLAHPELASGPSADVVAERVRAGEVVPMAMVFVADPAARCRRPANTISCTDQSTAVGNGIIILDKDCEKDMTSRICRSAIAREWAHIAGCKSELCANQVAARLADWSPPEIRTRSL